MNKALYQALSGNGQQGAPVIQSESPVAPEQANPTASAGPSLFQLLQSQPQQDNVVAANDSPYDSFNDAINKRRQPQPTPSPEPKNPNNVMWNS